MNPYLTATRNDHKIITPQNFELKKLNLSADSSVPVYLQLADQLQRVIEQGHYDPYKPLPSAAMVGRHLSVSHSTIFRAYTHLNRNGLVYWKKGEGFFVRVKSTDLR